MQTSMNFSLTGAKFSISFSFDFCASVGSLLWILVTSASSCVSVEGSCKILLELVSAREENLKLMRLPYHLGIQNVTINEISLVI